MGTITVTTPELTYEVHIERGLLDRVGTHIASRITGRTAFIVTDRHVAELYLDRVNRSLVEAGFKVDSYAIPPGETSKSKDILFELYDHFLDAGLTRSDVVVALGGGVPGDLGGFAASTWMRGVPVVQIPTTILSQIDSSLGGKTGIDLSRGKNLVGAFHQPTVVLTDPDTLHTLPARVRADGLAESLKHGAVFDPELFEWCAAGAPDVNPGYDTAWAVERNVGHKAGVVSRDTKETGERMLLNFGHTVGHAIEKVTGFSKYTHGEAVAVGMVAAVRLGIRLGVTPPSLADKLEQALLALHLPVRAENLSAEEISNAVLSDKKNRSGTLHFILLEEIGRARIVPMSADKAMALVEEVWRDV